MTREASMGVVTLTLSALIAEVLGDQSPNACILAPSPPRAASKPATHAV